VNVVRYADRPDLRARRRDELSGFPEYMNHNAMGWRYWGRLYDEFPAFQLALEDGDELVAEVHALPVHVDDELPAGWDDAFERGMELGDGNVLCLLAIAVQPDRRGGGVASALIEAARAAAAAAGLSAVIAPVRPTLKPRYPLIPIEQYIEWRRDDGSHFDPWIRVHERAGGAIVQAAPRSMVIEAPVADWEEWTEMPFPGDGSYIVPGMLAPLEVRDGVGVHVEPNVWLRHGVTRA
jgi:GNAT superfamily N-acetyltransferase